MHPSSEKRDTSIVHAMVKIGRSTLPAWQEMLDRGRATSSWEGWLVRPVTNSRVILVAGQARLSDDSQPAFVGTAVKECSGETHRREQEDGLNGVGKQTQQKEQRRLLCELRALK